MSGPPPGAGGGGPPGAGGPPGGGPPGGPPQPGKMEWGPRKCAEKTLKQIVDRYSLKEVTGADGGPFVRLKVPDDAPRGGGSEVGEMRIWSGEAVHKLVYVRATMEAIAMDSHMIFAFTAPDSLVPHFTLDAVKAPMGPHCSYHLDMIPRVDLGASLGYMNEVYSDAVTEVFNKAAQMKGFTSSAWPQPNYLTNLQLALMSPWCHAYRVDPDLYEENVGAFTEVYISRWFDLVDNGLSEAVRKNTAWQNPALRDRRNRFALFNPDTDKVWATMHRLLGKDVCDVMRHVQKSQVIEASWDEAVETYAKVGEQADDLA